jgi:hypothetical protein
MLLAAGKKWTTHEAPGAGGLPQGRAWESRWSMSRCVTLSPRQLLAVDRSERAFRFDRSASLVDSKAVSLKKAG